MDKLILIFGIISIVLFIIGLTKNYYNRINKSRVIYKYVERTLSEELENPKPPSLMYKDMFKKPSVWVGEGAEVVKNRDYYLS